MTRAESVIEPRPVPPVRDGFTVRSVYWVWRRELKVTLRGPILYVVGGLFLVVQGIAFAGLVNTLTDPRGPATLGALVEGQLAGSLLTWVLELVVLTLLGMRTIADERRSGGWELLLTAQVSERAAVIGKWLAASTLYALLWLPTLAYLALVAVYRNDTGGWDLASIAIGYAGAIALGAALLAWAVAASAATSSTLAAGGLGFALLIGLFLIGELGALWPDLAIDHPDLAGAVAAVSLRDRLSALARGEVSLSTLGVFVGLAVVGLSLAVTFACAGRRTRRELRTRTAATIALATVAVAGNILLVHHPMRWDAVGKSALDPQTRAVIAELPVPARITIVEPTIAALEPVYDEVVRVAERMAEVGPIAVTRIDPASIPGGIAAAAREAGVVKGNLESNGSVIVEVGTRRRVIDRAAIAIVELFADRPPAVERLAIEQALAGAIAELSTAAPTSVCATTGHGELSMIDAADAGDWTLVGNRLRADGMRIEAVTIDRALAEHCDVLVIAGPTSPLSAEESLAVQDFLHRGRGVFVAAATRPVPGAQLAATGLEGVLADDGIGLPLAIAVDPTLAVRELKGSLLVIDGYAPHPINVGFAGTRPTIWFQPRAVVATTGATPLVRASDASWGERDLVHAPPAKDPDDLAGPVALAVLGAKHKVIAIGSAESLTAPVLATGASAGDLWVARAIRFLAGRPMTRVAVAARTPEQVRLVMTPSERFSIIALSIAGIPLLWGAIGAAILLIRWRRRS